MAVELVHLGSLYHDDVMDEADTRRGVESVNARWGNLVAILAGDFLLARASEIAASLGTEVAGLLAATIGRLCEGQVRRAAADLRRRPHRGGLPRVHRGQDGVADVRRLPHRRAHGRASTGRAIEALTAFGEPFGMVFQIVDDVLDVVATDEQLGKPAGNDLVEGVYTLPVIRALAAETGEQLRRLLGRPLDRAGADEARDLIRSNGAVASSLDVARRFASEASDALAGFPDGPAVEALHAVGDGLIAAIPV